MPRSSLVEYHTIPFVKPFATLGSEISKVRERVRDSIGKRAESLRPAKVASDVRDQRDRLLAKLGEQTFRLIAERKLQVPRVLQDSVEKLAALLGVQLPSQGPDRPSVIENAMEAVAAVASDPLNEPSDIDEPSVGDATEIPAPSGRPALPKKKAATKKTGAKRRTKR
jgi:hypothetical protein